MRNISTPKSRHDEEIEMSQTTLERNKALVLEAFDTLFNKRDYEGAQRYWSPNYNIQHSAHIAPGREGLFDLVKCMPPRLKYEPGMIIAAGDLVRHPLLIFGYSRFNFVRALSILNCQSTPRCLAFVLSAQIPISDCSSGNSPMRRSLRHWLVRQLSSHSATFSQLPCFGV